MRISKSIPLYVFRVLSCAIIVMSMVADPHMQSSSVSTIVLRTADVPPHAVFGDWVRGSTLSAAGRAFLYNPDRGRAKVVPALAAPTSYFDMGFTATAGVPYHLWVRMRAESDRTSNDSVHVQFSSALSVTGAAFARIGTTASAEIVLQDGALGAAPRGWGWADSGWGTLAAPIYFATSGPQRLRIQQREDGAQIDQVVLSPTTYLSTAPGATRDDATILARAGASALPAPASPGTTVLWTANVSSSYVSGKWQAVADASAAGGRALRNPNASAAKIAPALANPASYFETTFEARANTAYHVWLRMRADGDSVWNDSVHLQFSDSVDASGAPVARIGTTGSSEFVLQGGSSGAPPHGWGWTDNGWGSAGPHLYFPTTGRRTLRVQQREDGAIVDQIVISPDAYLTRSPGWRNDDATIVAATAVNQRPTVTLTSPAAGALYTAPASIVLTASAADPEGRLSRVDFYANGMRVATDTTAPFTFTLSSVPAGSYNLIAAAYDADGAMASTPGLPVTVAAATSPWVIAFTASADHALQVTSYLLEVFRSGTDPATATPVATSNLLKPVPDANHEIRVDRSAFFVALSPGTYVAAVKAIGLAGFARSTTVPFTR
jgi:hypothetical protein